MTCISLVFLIRAVANLTNKQQIATLLSDSIFHHALVYKCTRAEDFTCFCFFYLDTLRTPGRQVKVKHQMQSLPPHKCTQIASGKCYQQKHRQSEMHIRFQTKGAPTLAGTCSLYTYEHSDCHSRGKAQRGMKRHQSSAHTCTVAHLLSL